MTSNHIANVAILLVIVVASHSAGARYVLSAQRQLPVWRAVLGTIFALALSVLLLSLRW